MRVLLLLAACGGAEPPRCMPTGTALPTDLACTGLYDSVDPTQYAADVMPYTPGVVLWSDGAEKHRYLYLPGPIDTSDPDAWVFRAGTKVWKEFVVGGTLVETRHFAKNDDGTWSAGTYVWDGTIATLNTSPKGIILASGYEIPTLKDCDKCHNGGADRLLGVEAVALALPGAQGATLSVLAQKGLLSNPPATTSLALSDDGKAAAAIGYLHANCGMPCHSTRGLGEETKLTMRIRAPELFGQTPIDMLDTFKATVGQAPTTASIAQQFPGADRITAGDHTKSLVWLVSHLRGNYQMPPLVSHAIDEAGTQQLADWIDAL